jgi:hypothetical protein
MKPDIFQIWESKAGARYITIDCHADGSFLAIYIPFAHENWEKVTLDPGWFSRAYFIRELLFGDRPISKEFA